MLLSNKSRLSLIAAIAVALVDLAGVTGIVRSAAAADLPINIISADSKGHFGLSLGKTDEELAVKEAYRSCGATRCHPIFATHERCLAIASTRVGKTWSTGISPGPDKSTASANAMAHCQRNGLAGCAIKHAACS